MEETRRTLSIGEVCEIVCVRPRTVYFWMETGGIQYVRAESGEVRIYADSIFPGGKIFKKGELLPITRVCETINVSRRTIYNWMYGGKLESVRTVSGSVRILADSMWLNKASK